MWVWNAGICLDDVLLGKMPDPSDIGPTIYRPATGLGILIMTYHGRPTTAAFIFSRDLDLKTQGGRSP